MFYFLGKARKLYLKMIYNAYYGFEQFRGLPIDGRYDVLEKKYRAKWCSGYSAGDKQFFARVKTVVEALKAADPDGDGSWTGPIGVFAEPYGDALRRGGMSKVKELMQANGVLQKATRRKRPRVESESPRQEEAV